MVNKGDKQRPAYLLSDFLNDAKRNKKKIIVANSVIESAKNLLQLYGKDQILNYISEFSEHKFIFVNCEPYRKGFKNDHPLVDSYKIELKSYDLYIAFCFTRITNGWCIKSLHSDRNDTISIGYMIKQKLETKK